MDDFVFILYMDCLAPRPEWYKSRKNLFHIPKFVLLFSSFKSTCKTFLFYCRFHVLFIYSQSFWGFSRYFFSKFLSLNFGLFAPWIISSIAEFACFGRNFRDAQNLMFIKFWKSTKSNAFSACNFFFSFSLCDCRRPFKISFSHNTMDNKRSFHANQIDFLIYKNY